MSDQPTEPPDSPEDNEPDTLATPEGDNEYLPGEPLSPLDGVGPDDLNLASLVARVASGGVKEVVLAVNATVDGQTTAHYVIDLLSPYTVDVTRLAHGVPVGGELDYLDDGTLAAAMRQRTAF